MKMKPFEEQTIVEKCRIRAGIRRQIETRKSVQEGKPDRIADTLEEAASEIEQLQRHVLVLQQENKELAREIEVLKAQDLIMMQRGSWN